MRIIAKCTTHPDAAVYVLAGTVKFQTSDSLQYVSEQGERASIVELDEHNLYCSAGVTEPLTDFDFNHNIVFHVLNADCTCDFCKK